MKIQCPLPDPKQCPEHALFHEAVNQLQVEQSTYMLKLFELKQRLTELTDEMGRVIEEIKRITGEK